MEARNSARQALQGLLVARNDTVTACARTSRGMRLLGQADLILVAEGIAGRAELLQQAEGAGLSIGMLFEPRCEGLPGLLYFARARFGPHKQAGQLLSSCGSWWEMRPNELAIHERYRKLLNRVGDGMVEVDGEDTIRWANAAMKRALGESELMGLRLEQLVKPADVPQLRSIRAQHAAGVVIPFPIRLATGQMVEVDPSPRFDSLGRPLGSSIVFRGVQAGEETERGRELFVLYSVATVLSQASSTEEALVAVVSRILEQLELAAGGVFLGSPHEPVQAVARGIELGEEADAALRGLCAEASKAHVVRDLAASDRPRLEALRAAGAQGVAVVPLQVKGEPIGSMWFVSTDPGHFSREVVSLLISVSVQMAVAVEHARHVEARLEEEASRRRFYRDALQAVTRGKLTLCELPDIDEVWEAAGEQLGSLEIRVGGDVPRVRGLVEEIFRSQGFIDDRCYEIALCASEAAGNVVKHAECGLLEVRANSESVSLKISDQGPGIHFSNLPRAVLSAGFSTAPSLGMGYSILLELVDALHLATGDGGTCLILEVARKASDPLEAFVGLNLDADW